MWCWMSGNPPGEITKLERLGMKVLVMEPSSLEVIADQIALLGRLAGAEQQADAAAAQFRRDIAALRREYQGRRKVSVFYQVWNAPLMTVNGKQIISEVIDLCGGKNIFADLQTLVPNVSLEAVLAADPEAIVTGSEQSPTQALDVWLRWKQLRAVRNGNLLVIPPDDISRATPRLLNGARRLCEQLDEVRSRELAAP
jgi:iron complex transport system substrate-binding protein